MEGYPSDLKKQTPAPVADAPSAPPSAEPEHNTPVNGEVKSIEEDPVNDDNLTPPPDSPMSDPSDPPHNTLEDEIVVGTNANGTKSSPLRVTSDQEDVDMEDAEDRTPISHYPKRKRASVYNELNEDKIENSMAAGDESDMRVGPGRPRTHGMAGVKGVILGYWRDSEVPNEEDKHAVIGFIDVRDRLRTRVQPINRAGKLVINEWPLPPGPGGSWVTFERVVFNKHLVNLDHNQVKEYVKIRTEAIGVHETEEEMEANDKAAVKEAIRRVQENPPVETATAPAIAYGPEIPEHAVVNHRPEMKKRRTGGVGTIADGVAAPPRNLIDTLPGTRPTKILLGYWKGSSEPRPEDRHAVFGILGANDMFRVKVTRETRDGRHVSGNFPTGAGALWIHWEEVEFEPHIKPLARPEIKEYVRVRQHQIDNGESPEDRIGNETKAVYEAQQRVTSVTRPEALQNLTYGNVGPAVAPAPAVPNGEDGYPELKAKREYTGHELRQSRRNLPDSKDAARAPRYSLPEASELRAANRTPSNLGNEDNITRSNNIARREIARFEARQMRNDQRAASREATASRENNKALFSDQVGRLNKVWAAQEANRLKAGTEDAKIHMGVKYERKQTGPFQGKLVSQGTIISIDGEDYVEYRVLTKPTFF
ncbi:uncharacterized protein E0L32_008501 [Thyridium curvatum]|uniref:Uncharacterized protein n=1 Tax=Thyridium curvatum TaxID=1093900 RepID=A0A507AJS7_9PEZI|nr:uncharacterized protein E0L32_008501 [Thyridium curvatum]TPX10615.1 hypothetical protein E0L32_008501 [Thyridium curvatum]